MSILPTSAPALACLLPRVKPGGAGWRVEPSAPRPACCAPLSRWMRGTVPCRSVGRHHGMALGLAAAPRKPAHAPTLPVWGRAASSRHACTDRSPGRFLHGAVVL